MEELCKGKGGGGVVPSPTAEVKIRLSGEVKGRDNAI